MSEYGLKFPMARDPYKIAFSTPATEAIACLIDSMSFDSKPNLFMADCF